MSTSPHKPAAQSVEFKGRTRADSKRRALAYWFAHQSNLHLDVRGFFQCCRLLPDGRTIVYYGPR